jgi:hypothetical protein
LPKPSSGRRRRPPITLLLFFFLLIIEGYVAPPVWPDGGALSAQLDYVCCIGVQGIHGSPAMGISGAAGQIPTAIAYRQLAGFPPIIGFYLIEVSHQRTIELVRLRCRESCVQNRPLFSALSANGVYGIPNAPSEAAFRAPDQVQATPNNRLLSCKRDWCLSQSP